MSVQGKARKAAIKWRGKRDVVVYFATNDFAFPLSTQMKTYQENFDELRNKMFSNHINKNL